MSVRSRNVLTAAALIGVLISVLVGCGACGLAGGRSGRPPAKPQAARETNCLFSDGGSGGRVRGGRSGAVGPRRLGGAGRPRADRRLLLRRQGGPAFEYGVGH